MTGYRFIVSNNAVQQVQNNTRICLNTAAVCNGTASLGPTGISLNGTVAFSPMVKKKKKEAKNDNKK